MQPRDSDPAKVLVINVSRIGDTLLCTPALRAIASAWPACKITFFGHPKRVEVIRHLPFLTRVGAISKQRAPWLGRLSALFGNRYDLAFVYGHDKPLLEFALRVAKRVVAFRQEDEAINSRLYRAVDHPAFQTTHAVNIQLLLPAALGVKPTGLALAYRVTDEESAWAAAESGKTLPAGAGPLIGLQVASFPTKAYRDWPIEYFMALCDRILIAYPAAHFLIFGGKEEQTRTEGLKTHLGTRASLYAGRLSLRQTAALMNRLDLYVGVDTGPTHLMGALHRPMVALYHAYSPSRVLAPLDHPCTYPVDHPRADQGASPETPMAEISVAAVWDKVATALASPLAKQGFPV